MSDIDLEREFPNMKPIRSAPGLGRVNGFGFGLIGRRDIHRESGSYVATRCLTLLFIPVLAIDAYRVARARGGLVAIGKEPLGGFAKLWNLALAVVIAGAVGYGGWQHHVTSPDYLAGQQLAEAREELQQGEHLRALKEAAKVAKGGTARAAEARTLVAEIAATIPQREPVEAVALLQGLDRAGIRAYPKAQLATDLDAAYQRLEQEQPEQAFELLPLIAEHGGGDDLEQRREVLLRRLVERQAGEVRWAVALAEILDARGESDACEPLLAPHAAALGSGEGARILGSIYAQHGDHAAAHPLLLGYCSERLQQLKQAEADYVSAQEQAWNRAFEALQRGEAGNSWYTRYESVNETLQQEMVTKWVGQRMEKDAKLEAAIERLRAIGAIVPVALELGIVTLNRAHDQTDPDERERELAAAEETFLAIRGLAGDTDEFHLFYGQVCYWLGKREDGKAEFDQLLETHERAPQMLLMVANSIRDIGMLTEARALCEEAYASASTEEERYAAAGLRARTPTDREDGLTWLKRCDQDEPEIRCQLASAKARQAYETGDLAAAERNFRIALRGYDEMPTSSALLNNSALVAHMLYGCTGDPADLDDSIRRLDEALALAPSDTIVQYHLALRLEARAVAQVVAAHIDPALVPLPDHWSLVPFCYADAAGRAAIYGALAEHPDWQRCVALFDRLAVLFAQDPDVHRANVRHRAVARDVAGLERIAERLQGLELDHAEAIVAAAVTYAEDDPTLVTSSRSLLQLLDGIDRSADPMAAAAAADMAVAIVVGTATNGGEVDFDRQVAAAEAALAQHRSAGAISTLIAALAARASWGLAATDARYGALHERCHRAIGDLELLAWAAGNGQDLTANADCVRLAELVVELHASDPEGGSAAHWALLRGLGHTEADALAATIAADEVAARRNQLTVALDPTDCSSALALAWRGQAAGDPEPGARALRACADLGLPVPGW